MQLYMPVNGQYIENASLHGCNLLEQLPGQRSGVPGSTMYMPKLMNINNHENVNIIL